MNFTNINISPTGIVQDYLYSAGDPAVTVESCKVQCYQQMHYLYFIPLFITITSYIIMVLITAGVIKREIKLNNKYYLDIFELIKGLYLIFSIIILACLYFKIF